MLFELMKELLTIFVLGIIILVGAILINLAAHQIGLGTWYDFSLLVGEKGFFGAIEEEGFLSGLFLFIIYPFLLGLIGWIVAKKLGF